MFFFDFFACRVEDPTSVWQVQAVPFGKQFLPLIVSGENPDLSSRAQSGSVQTSPTARPILSNGKSEAGVGFHIEIAPGEKLMVGFVRVGPITVRSSLTGDRPMEKY